MKILNNLVKIPKSENISSFYIEDELKKLGFENVLRWAIVESDEDFLTINFSSF